MMPRFEIVEGREHHCGAMARLLRAEHRAAVARLGLNSHRELRQRFDASAFRRAWLIDGRLAAIGGVSGPMLAAEGYVWLAMSQHATRFRIEAVREARRQLDEIMAVKRLLVTSILDGDQASKRFAIFLGFVLADEETAQPAASRFGRRNLSERFEMNSGARIDIGCGTAIAMAYRHDRQLEVA